MDCIPHFVTRKTINFLIRVYMSIFSDEKRKKHQS